MALSEREQKLMYATLAVAVIGGLFILYGVWSNAAAQAELSQSTTLHFQDLLEKIENVEQQKEKNLTYKRRIENPDGQFATEAQTSQLISSLMEIAGRSQFNVKSYDPNFNQRARPMPKLEIRLNAECKFNGLVKFLDNLRHGDYLIQPTSIRVNPKSKNSPDLNVQMTLMTFLLDKTHSVAGPSLSIQPGGQS